MWCIEKSTGTVLYQNEVVGQLGCSEIILLCRMLEEPFKMFTKDELLDLGWPNKIVAPNSLTVAIKNIRKILGYRPSQLSIKTMHGQGYTLLLPVENEISIVDRLPALEQGVSNEGIVSDIDGQELVKKTPSVNGSDSYKRQRQKKLFLRLKLSAMFTLFFCWFH